LNWRIAWGALIVVATLVVTWLNTVGPGTEWWSPLSLIVVIGALVTESMVLAYFPILVAAALLSIPPALGRVRIPWWTAAPILGAIVLGWCYFANGISLGVRFQGMPFVVGWGSIQAAITIALVGLCLANIRYPNYILVLIWHMLASVWLANYAFPVYGEL
jgi:hypothetical protein